MVLGFIKPPEEDKEDKEIRRAETWFIYAYFLGKQEDMCFLGCFWPCVWSGDGSHMFVIVLENVFPFAYKNILRN